MERIQRLALKIESHKIKCHVVFHAPRCIFTRLVVHVYMNCDWSHYERKAVLKIALPQRNVLVRLLSCDYVCLEESFRVVSQFRLIQIFETGV
jgi:hypothetical protein